MFGTVPDYFAQSNNNITIPCKSRQQGVDNVDAIAATTGVDGILLAQTIWPLRWAIWAMLPIRKCRKLSSTFCQREKHGKPSGILAPVEADARRYLEWGATFVAVGSDTGVFRSATQKLADSLRNNHHRN